MAYKLQFKNMKSYAETDGKNIYVDRTKFKGLEGLDSLVHEINHVNNMKASERDIIKKTKKDMNSYLSII